MMKKKTYKQDKKNIYINLEDLIINVEKSKMKNGIKNHLLSRLMRYREEKVSLSLSMKMKEKR